MDISLVYATIHPTTDTAPWLQLNVPDDCTLKQAVELSGIVERYPEIDLGKQRVGIFGKLATPETSLKPGDRVEIYLPVIRVDEEDDDDDDD